MKEALGTGGAHIDVRKDVLDVLLVMLSSRERVIPIFDGPKFVGVVNVSSYARILRDMKERKPESICVADVMDKKPKTLAPDTNISQIISSICQKGVYGIPVASGHEFIGIIRREDILQKCMHLLKGRFKVQDAMSYHLSTNSVHDPLEKLAKKILMGYDRRLVIMDGDSLKGTVDILDLANVLLSEGVDLYTMSVKDILLPNAVTVSKNDDITKAVKVMFEWKMWGIPVVNERLEGVVRDKDIIQRLCTIL